MNTDSEEDSGLKVTRQRRS